MISGNAKVSASPPAPSRVGDDGDGDGDGGEDEDGVNGANNDDDDDASSRSILYRRDTAREKCLNCKRGPRSWYSANFGIRRGRWFFYSKLVFELLEWRFVCCCWLAFPRVALCSLVLHCVALCCIVFDFGWN